MKNLEINVIILINESKINCAVDNYIIGKVVKMTTEELEILVKQGEGYTLEFKENLGKKFAVEVVALANSMGGKILIGVDDDGNIIGTDTSNNQRANIQNQISQIEPRINVKIEVVDNVMVVNVPEGDDKPYSSSDGYYLRAGSMCQKMNRNEIREYLEDGGKISQETRRFNPLTSETSTMRSKEDAIDYRYFPDPDLAPLIITQELIDSIKKELPELPEAKRERYIKDNSSIL